MTKEEQNQIIKDSLVRNLQKEVNIPEDIGVIYKNWVLGKIQEANNQLTQSTQQGQTNNGQEEASQ